MGRLSTDAMAKEAVALVGRHNFTSVRATRCSAASPVRELHARRARRALAGPAVPAHGLVLERVRYPADAARRSPA